MRQDSSFSYYRLGGCTRVFVRNIFNIVTDLNVFNELTFLGLISTPVSIFMAHGPILKAQDIHVRS